MPHPALKQARAAARRLDPAAAKVLLEAYTPVHSMREHVGWWSQSGEAEFKRELGRVAGIIKGRKND